MDSAKLNVRFPKCRIIKIGRNIDFVFSHVLADNIIRQTAAKIETVTLTQRIENCAVVMSEHLARLFIDDLPRLLLNVF
ncbi:hypothetical protein D3C87_1739960 [compost metagenome]